MLNVVKNFISDIDSLGFTLFLFLTIPGEDFSDSGYASTNRKMSARSFWRLLFRRVSS